MNELLVQVDPQHAPQDVMVVGPPEPEMLMDCADGEVRPVEFWPSKVLSRRSDPVEAFDGELRKLVADLAYTMYSLGGIGIAAPQIGVHRRVFLCDIFANARPEKGRPASQLLVAVNPSIVWSGQGEEISNEGCLSFPGVLEPVRRPVVVRLRAWTHKGKEYALQAGGMLGRVIQHELDHLDGVVFIERMTPMDREKVERKQQRFRRNVEADRVRLRPRSR